MFLVNYSSSSDSESGDQSDINKLENNKLMPPVISAGNTILPKAISLLGKRKHNSDTDTDHITDDPSLHQGRIRSFKHERGNWATYVFISANGLNVLEDIQDICSKQLNSECELISATDLHMSLSKTVVLQYHFIESFVKNLEDNLCGVASLSISYSDLKVYTNAERTRTFLAVKVDDIHLEKLLYISKKINSVMVNFRLEKFYEDPSFHISILWCVGDCVDLINRHLSIIASSVMELFPIKLNINRISCKIGFKEYHCELKN